jgi:UDP-N-acetylmuramate dehydrogenase
MGELAARREASQPLSAPSAGSVFRRPVGAYVGPMVEACGLKGYAAGGAQVSEKHAGFIVNSGGATARDVQQVIAHVQSSVFGMFGIELETELRIIGEDNAETG